MARIKPTTIGWLLVLMLPALFYGSIVGWIWLPMIFTDTRYAPEYSSKGWKSLEPGSTIDEVHAAVGEPIDKSGYFFAPEAWEYRNAGTTFFFDDNRVVRVEDSEGIRQEGDPIVGASYATIHEKFGQPDARRHLTTKEVWHYSESPSGSHFRARALIVDLSQRIVVEQHDYFYFD